MLLGPPFYYDFLFRVELDAIAPLAMEDAEEAVFPSTEREVGHRSGHADIDSDIARRRFITKTPGRRAAGSKKRRLIAKRAARQKFEGFVQIARMHQAQHRAEYFCVGELAGRRQAIDHGGFHKAAGFILRNRRFAAVKRQL